MKSIKIFATTMSENEMMQMLYNSTRNILLLLLLTTPVQLYAQEPVRVKIASLADVVIYPERNAPATAISLNNTMISAEIVASIKDIKVNVGDVIDKGQLMVELDCSDYRFSLSASEAEIDALKARIKLAKLKLTRTQELLSKQSISEEVRDERESELTVLQSDLRASQSRLNTSKLNVDRCSIVSPYRALVKDRIASVGQFASIGTPLLELVDLEHMEVSAQIFSQDTYQLHDAKELVFEHNGEYYPLTLKRIVPAINTETRNQEVRLLFKGKQALPGTAGKLIWRDKQAHIPGKYIVNRGDDAGFFYVNDEDAHFQIIDNASTGRTTAVNFSLNIRIITEGYYGLEDGTPVYISNTP